MFETYRENFDGKYWFPTYVRSDDYYKLTDNQNQPVVPARGKQRNGKPIQEQDNTTLDDKPKQEPETQPDEEVQLRLIVRCTDFKVQTPGDVSAGAGSDTTAPNAQAQPESPR
jgi:hypothetical protein